MPKIMQTFDYAGSVNINKVFLLPDVPKILFKCQSFGGRGGFSNGVNGGGGGGAGCFYDDYMDIEPLSLCLVNALITGDQGGITLTFIPPNNSPSYTYAETLYMAMGQQGGNASGVAVGVGGNSGGGMPDPVTLAPPLTSRGQLDAFNKVHSGSGSSGRVSPAAAIPQYALRISAISGGTQVNFTNGDIKNCNGSPGVSSVTGVVTDSYNGGLGGQSYFPGFGYGGRGQGASAPQNGGNAFVSFEW
jgi:hypothetical protein